jgi:hypothetical protein
MTAVKQCSRCELRFPNERELVWHLAHDHDAEELAEALVRTQGSRHELERQARRRAVTHVPPRNVRAGVRATPARRAARGG